VNNPILILGATSGIARAIAHRFASEKHDLILAGRDSEELNRDSADLSVRYGIQAIPIIFDATNFNSHESFFQSCLALAPELFGIVLAHGYLSPQIQAQSNWSESKRIIQTNYVSAVSILNLAANHLESRKQGFICIISSVAGDRGRQSNYIYCSAKSAVSTFAQGLRHRLSKSNVNVITIKPGFVDTSMTWGLPGVFLSGTPERVAASIVRAIRKNRAVLYTPWFWRWIMLIVRNIPDRIFNKTKM
jgi:short-subunit dehydrogenase